MPIVPDTKDWTWVLERPCPECGFDATELTVNAVPALVRANAALWPGVLSRSDVVSRPNDSTWSALEYAAHVRDVYRIMAERAVLILEQDAPTFPSWDQDVTAVEERYNEQDPSTVAREIGEAAEAFARVVGTAPESAYGRRGRRSDGAEFTFGTLALYALHDPTHHAHDVNASSETSS